MIHYNLRCDQGHEFDSWFQSSAAFDTLAKAGHLNCAACGSSKVAKAVMAPRLAPRSAAPGTTAQRSSPPAAQPPVPAAAPAPELAGPRNPTEAALVELQRKVEANAEYVGRDFVREARAMHLGDRPERAIYGEARLDQAKSLIEDGVPLMPLPFRPSKKVN